MSEYGEELASGYAKTVSMPTREYCEAWMFRKLWGNITGQSALDVACGNGFVTRLLWEAETQQITGIDLSSDMLQSFDATLSEQQNVSIECADIRDYQADSLFDLATSAFLFNEAESEE